MQRRSVPAALLPALILLAGTPARAQDAIEAFIGRPVAEVRILIEAEPEADPALLSLVDVRIGQPLSVEAVRTTMERFGRLARFEDVRVLALERPEGLVITVRLEPRHPIDRIEIAGQTGLPPRDLERRVRDQFGGLPPAGANLRTVEQTLERYLNDEGFLAATASAGTVPMHEPERATLVITVEAGTRATIREPTIVNRSPLAVDRIRRQTNLLSGQPYRPRALATAASALRDELIGRGYYSAVVTTEPIIDGTAVDVRVVVESGPIVRIAWSGDRRPSGNEDDYVPIRREGSVDEDLLEDADAAIRGALQREGFRDAAVTHTRTQQDGELVITFDVRRGRRYRIARVDLPTGLHLPDATIRGELGVEPGQPLDQARIDAGMRRVLLAYQRQGYYAASAVPEIEEVPERSTPAETWVVLHPTITEGPLGIVTDVQFEFADGAHVVQEYELREVMRLGSGRPFAVTSAYLDRLDLETLYADRGFREATVEVLEPTFAADGTEVSLVVRVVEGPQTIVGDITVVGNQRLSEEAILDQMALRIGQPLGRADEVESRRRLAELGVGRVSISEQPRLPGDNVAHLIVSVDEAPASSVGYGGGLEMRTVAQQVEGGGVEDRLEVSPRGFFEIGRRNIGGRNSSLNFFSRVSLRRSARVLEDESDGRLGFIEYRTTVTYRERRAFGTDTDMLVGVTSEQAGRTNFNFLRRAVNAEFLRRLTPQLSVSGRYALDFTKLFDEIIAPADQLLIDRLFPQVRLSLFSTGMAWDRRDNPIAPTRGVLLSADFETALRSIGSEVGYVKTFFQASQFTTMSDSRRHVLATRAQLGLARGFERRIGEIDNPPPAPVVLDPDAVVADLPASQRFFAGGSTTVRGFQLDRLGVSEILNADGLSNGGNAVVVLNAELRSRVATLFGRGLAAVGFVDGGNVFAKAGDLDLDRLRGAVGIGVRYDSPLGPLRLDVGFKMNRLMLTGGRERRWELHLSIGEAF